MNQEDRSIVRPTQAAEFLSISKPTLYRLAKSGALPPPIKISKSASGWQKKTLLEYIKTRENYV